VPSSTAPAAASRPTTGLATEVPRLSQERHPGQRTALTGGDASIRLAAASAEPTAIQSMKYSTWSSIPTPASACSVNSVAVRAPDRTADTISRTVHR
jgi:hypothetical protein